jgi:hypothetical protein
MIVDQKNAEDMSVAGFEGEYWEFDETSPDVPLLFSSSVSTNPKNPPGVQPCTTTSNLEPEREGAVDSGEKANFIDLDAIMVETEVGEALKSRRGKDGGPQFYFLSAERKEKGRISS